MSTPCDVLDDLTQVGGHLVEEGNRKYGEWSKEMDKLVPNLSEGVKQRTWGRVRAELAQNSTIHTRMVSNVFVDNLGRRIGRQNASDFIETVADQHPDIYEKLINGDALTPDELTTVGPIYADHTVKGKAAKAAQANKGMQELSAALKASNAQIRQGQSPRGGRTGTRGQSNATALTPEQSLTTQISGRLGKENGDKFVADMKANHPDIWNNVVNGQSLTDGERQTMGALYNGYRKVVPLTGQQTPTTGIGDVLRAANESRRQVQQDLRAATAPQRRLANQTRNVNASVDRRLADMENLFPDRPKRQDMTPIALRAYRDSAGNLTRFAKQIDTYFPGLDDATKRQIFSQAAQDFRARSQSVEDIKAGMLDAVKKDVLANQPKWKKVLNTAQDVVNAPRALIASADFSAPLRQGNKLTLSHPVLAVFNRESPFVKMIGAGLHGGQQIADAVHADIATRPTAPLYKESGLSFSEYGHKIDLTKGEDLFRTNLATKLPWVNSSERAYVTYMNKLRADSFDMFYNQLAKGGKEPSQEDLKTIADYINVATGRGTGKALDNFAKVAGNILFAPRNTVSQFQYAMGQPLGSAVGKAITGKGSGQAAKIVAGEYGRYLAAVTTMYALAKLGGGDVDFDPRSKAFMQIRFGKTIIDPIAGVQQPIVLAAQMFSDQKRTQSGKLVDKPGLQTGIEFARGKLAPLPASAVDFMARGLPNDNVPHIGDRLIENSLKSPKWPNGEYRAPYGKDFLGRDVSQQGGFFTDATSLFNRQPGVQPGQEEFRRDRGTAWARAADYYGSRLAIPITASDIAQAFSQSGGRIQDVPESLIPVTLGIFGATARTMDPSEIDRRKQSTQR